MSIFSCLSGHCNKVLGEMLLEVVALSALDFESPSTGRLALLFLAVGPRSSEHCASLASLHCSGPGWRRSCLGGSLPYAVAFWSECMPVVVSEAMLWPTRTICADLGSFDMVVKVVTERLDVRDDVGHALRCKVPRKQDLAQSVESLNSGRESPAYQRSHSLSHQCWSSEPQARLAAPGAGPYGTAPVARSE